MKILAIYLKGLGPIPLKTLDFNDAWTGKAYEKILMTGPNGTGKSTILRSIAHLWKMVGRWLTVLEIIPKRDPSSAWLREHTDAIGLIVEGVPGMGSEKVGLYFGSREYFSEIKLGAPQWMGEVYEDKSKKSFSLIHHGEWFREWANAFGVFRLSFEPSETKFRTPNMVYLEAEERRWVRPKGNPDQLIPDNPANRWLVSYQASEKWEGQLESSLLVLKTLDEAKFQTVLAELNAFLIGKKIRQQPTLSLRLLVDIKTKNGACNHTLDDLSAGERQVLIQLFLISRWLEPGGIVLLDEPDLHLHPSLIQMLLGRIEAIVSERGGQLIITSHLPEIWERYEKSALRVSLVGDK